MIPTTVDRVDKSVSRVPFAKDQAVLVVPMMGKYFAMVNASLRLALVGCCFHFFVCVYVFCFPYYDFLIDYELCFVLRIMFCFILIFVS